MPSSVLKSPTDALEFASVLGKQQFPLTVDWSEGEGKTNSQNRTIHMWFSQIDKAQGHVSGWTKGACKLAYGLPSMIVDRPLWVAKWEPLYQPILDSDADFESKVLLFEAIPMTRHFLKHQMAAFMSDVQMAAIQRGIHLTDPDAKKYEGAMR